MKPHAVRNVRFNRLESGGPVRQFERLLLRNRAVNAFISESGKLFLACLIWPRFVAPFRWRLTCHPMPLANLDPVFTGYKILQLTDLHVGKTRLDYLAQVFDRTLEEKPDLVVLTGDLIDYRPSALPKLKQLFRHLTDGPFKAPDGILAIFGNHDYHEYSWRHIGPRSARRAVHKRLVRLVQDSGIRLLRNEQHVITRPTSGGSAKFTIVGIDEMWTGLANADKAFRGLVPAEPILCLQHNPDGVEFLKPYPWQYMLCGHSHGGQANFP
jgi:predicted MPP superfamily phosphohydrolase